MRYVVYAVIAVIGTSLGAQTVPPASLQFEVASVRPVAQDETGGGMRAMFQQRIARSLRKPGEIPMTGTDRVSLQGWTLVDLIAAAYSLDTTRVSGPAWLSDENFDIEAKVIPGTPKGDLNAMLQSLLEERFHLKARRDTRIGPGFALVVGKDGPKMELAVPPAPLPEGLTDEERRAQAEQKIRASMEEASRNRAKEAPAGPPVSVAKWSSITMHDLAVHLERGAGAPVIDDTGLTGKYVVRLATSPGPQFPGDTIFDAVEKLGLKLESRKLPVERVIVDEVSKTPTEN
jgi:uncharacterized protein (TIGR03435 family)